MKTMWTCFMILFLSFFTDWELAEGRQYDLNAESIKLFGEDLNMTLQRFHQTPEYLKILNFRVAKLIENRNYMMRYVAEAYRTKVLATRIEDALNNLYKDDKHNHRPSFRRVSSYDSITPVIPELYSESLRSDNTTTSTLSPVEILDAFVMARSLFSAAERNAFKEIGFQVAKAAVQRMIKEMGPEEDNSERKSTRMPPTDNKGNTKKETTATKHVTASTEPNESVHILRADDTDDSSASFYFRFGKT